jgi:predicted RNA-binding protein
MCLSKAYLRPVGGSERSGEADGVNGTVLLMDNVTSVEIEGDQLRLRNLFGATESLHGRITSIDFSEGRMILHALDRVEALEVQHG